MHFTLEPEHSSFQDQLRSFLDDVPEAPQNRNEVEALESEGGGAFLAQLEEAGWLGVGWPRDFGGQGRSAIEQWLFLEEMAYRRLPTGGLSVSSVGPTIMRVGTEEQKQRYLPGILRGEIDFAVGYSEPNAGTDLASLETRAVREGDEYVINGQKIYTTAAHYATHIWLAARTGGREVKHRGISVIIVPLDTPGITVRPLYTQAGVRTNEVFLEDVRVPVANRVGEENAGWYIIAMALDFERIFPYSGLAREFERLVEWAGEQDMGSQGTTVLEDPVARQSLAELAVDLEVARLFSLRTAWMIEQGEVPNVEASINKVWLSELRQRVASAALGLMGEAGQLRVGTDGAPLDGDFEQIYRFFPMLKFGGGTNEIQRNIIAQRGLGLPR